MSFNKISGDITYNLPSTAKISESWFPATYLLWINAKSFSIPPTIIRLVNSANGSDLVALALLTGPGFRFVTQSAAGGGLKFTDVTTGSVNTWYLFVGEYLNLSSRTVRVFTQAGAETTNINTGTSSAYTTPRPNQYRHFFGSMSTDVVSVEHITIYPGILPYQFYRELAKGAHPLSLGWPVTFYQPLKSAWNEPFSQGPRIFTSTVTSTFNANSAPVRSYTPSGLYLPRPIVWPPSIASSGSTYAEAITEGAKAGDSLVAALIISAAISEGAKAGDADVITASLALAISEGAKAGESWALNLIAAASITEGAKAGDTFTSALASAYSEAIAEGSKAGDAFVSALTVAALIIEGAKAGDAFTAMLGNISAAINEGALAGDTFAAALTMAMAISEGALAGDAMTSPGRGYMVATISILNALAGSASLRNLITGTVDIDPD